MEWEREQIGNCTLYCGDCRAILPTLEPVDAVVADPPYGVGYAYASYNDDSLGHQAQCSLWLSAMRAVAPTVFVFTGVGSLFLWERPSWILAWHKEFSVTHSPFGANNWEPVAVYGKLRHNERPSDFFAGTFVHMGAIGHPCPKPEKALREVIRIASKLGEHILDPFMGSGTAGVACVQLGRTFTGIEIERQYFDLACRRIEESQRQGNLFWQTEHSKRRSKVAERQALVAQEQLYP